MFDMEEFDRHRRRTQRFIVVVQLIVFLMIAAMFVGFIWFGVEVSDHGLKEIVNRVWNGSGG